MEIQVANNVIKGPWVCTDPPRNSHVFVPSEQLVDSSDAVKVFKATHITETLVAVMPMFFNNLELAGFNFDEVQTNDTIKDGTLIVETVKSLLCKYYGIHHPMQDVAEHTFRIDDNGTCEYEEKISLDLVPMEEIAIALEEPEQDLLEE